MTQIIQASVIQIDELEARFGFVAVLDDLFFREWQGDPSVCLDLMVRTLLPMGATREDVAIAITASQS